MIQREADKTQPRISAQVSLGDRTQRLNVLLVCRYLLSLFDEATADIVVISLIGAFV